MSPEEQKGRKAPGTKESVAETRPSALDSTTMSPEEQKGRKAPGAKESVAETRPSALDSTTSALEKAGGFLSDVLAQAERAYTAHLEAQKEVVRAYKENERQIYADYKSSEAKANHDYEEAIEEAKKALEEAEKQSELACKAAKDLAKQTYEAMVLQALKVHSETLEKVQAERAKTMEQSWSIFIRAIGQKVAV